MIGIIVTGHGKFASGLSSSVELIAGLPQSYEAVDFLAEYSTDDLKQKLNEAMDKLTECEGIIVFSDLAGGSPFKTAVEISVERKEDIQVLAGTNLGMLIEISMARGFITEMSSLVEMAINTGKDQVTHFAFQQKVVEECEDGI